MTTRFLIAKYAPDVRRMEPCNIGVIVWNDGMIEARFLGEGGNPPRRIHVQDAKKYKLWVESWRTQLSKPSLETNRGRVVPRQSEEFLEVLQEWSRGNYLLVDGGELIDNGSLEVIVDHLFDQMVSTPEDQQNSAERESERLKRFAHDAIRSSGITDHPNFRRKEPQWYRVHGVQRTLNLDYVIGPTEKPYSFYQRVLLGHQNTFDSAVLHLEWFVKSRDFHKERCAALIVSPMQETPEIRANRDILSEVATVVEVDQPEKARRMLGTMASLNGS